LTLDTINEVIEETTIELDRKPSVLEVKSEKVEEELVLKPSNIIVKSLELDSPEIKEFPKKADRSVDTKTEKPSKNDIKPKKVETEIIEKPEQPDLKKKPDEPPKTKVNLERPSKNIIKPPQAENSDNTFSTEISQPCESKKDEPKIGEESQKVEEPCEITSKKKSTKPKAKETLQEAEKKPKSKDEPSTKEETPKLTSSIPEKNLADNNKLTEETQTQETTKKSSKKAAKLDIIEGSQESFETKLKKPL